jgi:putative endonuclease
MQHGAKRSDALQTRDPGCLNRRKWLSSQMAEFYVYILASRYRGTMYVGVTNDLSRRIGEHKSGAVPGFTKRYKVNLLVYCEGHASVLEAREREHVLKRWRRDWKFELIEAQNPDWRDLTDQL